MKDKKKILIGFLSIIGIILVTVGVTYAFFNFRKIGNNEQSISSGKITFHYKENSGIGNGITLTDMFPISDDTGKSQTGAGKVFDFKITSNTINKVAIPYEITARLNGDDIGEVIKVYLTRIRNGIEEELLLSKYSELTQSTNENANGYTEKTLFTGIVTPNTNYSEDYRLRIWLDSSVNFSPVEETKYYCDNNEVTESTYENCSGEKNTEIEIIYPYNNKRFTLTVNAYASGRTLAGDTVYVASDVKYTNEKSDRCTELANQTIECAIRELKDIFE